MYYKNVNGESIKMTANEIKEYEADLVRFAKEKAAKDYSKKRLRAYPAVRDQLDMLFKELEEKGSIDKTGDWFMTIKGIKIAYPKPGGE